MSNTVNHRNALLAKYDVLSRLGKWVEAEKALRECFALGLVYSADFNLALATLEWRKACADEARLLLRDGPVEAEVFRRQLAAKFEPYVVEWMMAGFSGLRLVEQSSVVFVEAVDGKEA